LHILNYRTPKMENKKDISKEEQELINKGLLVKKANSTSKVIADRNLKKRLVIGMQNGFEKTII
jgi:hypothetical protein